MPRTVWLASYPKSGNTWFRIFMANLLHPDLAPVHFNTLPVQTPIASNRGHFEAVLGMPSTLLTHDEIDRLRPAADAEVARGWSQPLLLRKAHDAYVLLGDGTPMMGRGPDFAAIYFLRHPWDVAPSYANHMSCTLDHAVDAMCDPEQAMAPSRKGANAQLRQRLLSWEGHASSWLAAPLPLHLMRYERMRADPPAAFRGAVRFLGLDHDDAAIEAALEASRLERMQEQEAAGRFRETPRDAARFFRSGRVGEGLDRLTGEQVDRLRGMQARVEAAIVAREAT